MENLYTFSKNSWHVQFFKWMWNIDPTEKYKTMCPYFWQFIGSLFLLPFIILWKIAHWIVIPIDKWIEKWTEESSEREMQDILYQFRQASTSEEKYNLWKSKCYKKYIDGLIDMNTISNEELGKFRYDAYAYERDLEHEKEYNKAKRQANIDKIRYGIIGRLFIYILTGIILFLVGIFINWFVHLFTLDAFLDALIIFFFILIGTAIFLTIMYIIITIDEKYNCNGQLTKFNPFIYIIMMFKGVWKVLIIIVDMIKNLYKESCPIITWKE